jgi:four helix bundle protein
MKYNRFEELPVWQDAIELAVRVFALTSTASFRRHRSVRDQIERAAMSVSNNIAEGFERGTTQETLTFLYISRGSCGETRSILCLSERLPGISNGGANLRSEISDLKSKSESVSRQLRAWADSLQNTDIRGQRYLNDKTKRLAKAAREREEFLKELEEIRNRKT